MSVEDDIFRLKRAVGGGLGGPGASERIEASLGMDNGDPTSLGILTGRISRESESEAHESDSNPLVAKRRHEGIRRLLTWRRR